MATCWRSHGEHILAGAVPGMVASLCHIPTTHRAQEVSLFHAHFPLSVITASTGQLDPAYFLPISHHGKYRTTRSSVFSHIYILAR